MPLFQFGAINTGRYKAGAMPQGTNLFSWPMNNYWVTNFNADQRGGHNWSYYFTSGKDVSDNFSTFFGLSSRIPMLVRILPGDGKGDNNFEGSYIKGWPSNIILVSSKPLPEQNAILIHVRELDGKQCTPELYNGISGKRLSITETDVTGQEVKNSANLIGPYESKFYIVRNTF
jgi:hypothetical protein